MTAEIWYVPDQQIRFLFSSLCNSGSFTTRSFSHLFQIHALHRLIHTPHHIRHAAGHTPHGNSSLDSRAHGIDSAGESEKLQVFVFLPNGVAGVYFGDVVVALRYGLDRTSQRGEGGKARGRRGKGQTYLLELRLLGLFIFAGFGGLAVELLGCELRVVDGVSVRRAGGEEEEEEMEVAFARDAP